MKTQSRKKRNQKYIREKNGLRLNSKLFKLRSYFKTEIKDADLLLLEIEKHSKIQINQIYDKYKIPVSIKSVRLGYENRDFIENKLTVLLEYIADYYYNGKLEHQDTTTN